MQVQPVPAPSMSAGWRINCMRLQEMSSSHGCALDQDFHQVCSFLPSMPIISGATAHHKCTIAVQLGVFLQKLPAPHQSQLRGDDVAGEMCVLAYGIMTFSDAHSDVFTSMQGSVLGQGAAQIPPRIEIAAVRLYSSPAHVICKRQLSCLLACCTIKGSIDALLRSALCHFLLASQLFGSCA